MPPKFINRNNTLGKIDAPKLQVKLFGQWEESIQILNRLSPEIKSASIKAQLKICNDIKKKVKAHLVNQDLNWQKLSTSYAQRKAKMGFDSRTLISTAAYYYAINAWVVGNQHLVLVGVKSGTYSYNTSGKKNKLDVARIAAMHEFSSGKRLPRRELWNPTIRELGGKRGLTNLFVTSFVATLRRNGIPIKDFSNFKL